MHTRVISIKKICLDYKSDVLSWLTILCLSGISVCIADQVPDINTLKKRQQLDAYYSNVLLGYNIINDTQSYARRFTGNKLNCTDCHREAGTKPGQLPLNVAGMYPRWRSKNAQMVDLTQMIRECFVYSQNGVMPPAYAPEVNAIKAYIAYLSNNQVIGKPPKGRGVPTLEKTLDDPNLYNGEIVYQQRCASCHGTDGHGLWENPPVWGINSYTRGSGLNDIYLAAGFIMTKMSETGESKLSVQQALDISAYLNKQTRPVDPGKAKLPRLLQDIYGLFGE